MFEQLKWLFTLKLNDNEMYNYDFTKFGYPAEIDLSGNHITDVSTLNNVDPINWRHVELKLDNQTIVLPENTIEDNTYTIDSMMTGFDGETLEFDSGASESFFTGETKEMNASWKLDYSYIIRELETRKSSKEVIPRDDGMLDYIVDVTFSGVVTQEVTAEVSKSEVKGNDITIETGSTPLSNEELIKQLGISAIDYDGSEITPEFKIVSNDIDYKNPGTYSGTISFTDSLGMEVTNTFNVEVVGDAVLSEESGQLPKTGMVNIAGIFIIMFATMIKLRKTFT